ncbi:TRAP transporter fused permease subunit [Azospirillum sp. RWY-5-1]|uniref:TRAP transporter fused permease subunit n=1 Tax=Azospirillum oleiclasticum TaxID=2735135 RepID=A0ABX2TE19_9PROT|nr:TRAP transporter fused permease subunit [Azospirillum oleiclasticum]NYZ22560.1 TRAP transporter fused permease subunit [Azospirillum oleiclasticum]
MRDTLTKVVAVLLGGFILYTAAFGTFEGLIQRAIFVAIVVGLGLLMFPLGRGTRWSGAGIAVDIVLAAVTFAGCGYVIVEYETIMGSLPTAGTLDIALTAGLVLAILEVSRRAIGGVFPTIVLLGIAYALLGHLLPGKLGHRGFDMEFVTETLLLGDLGIWGLLVGVAATTIGAFILFGSALLFTGGGQTFMDLAVRVSGRSPGGAAKVATVASGLFGMISGSAVANVATTGNFTIPLMKRLGYPAPLAGGIEAVASTGGQIAPPVMGAAAFVMAEIIGRSYFDIAMAAALPAFLFYLGAFATVHLIARERGLRVVPESEMPPWSDILTARRIAPILAAFGGLFYGILTGRSVQTAAFFGVMAMLVPYVGLNIRSGSDLRTVLTTLVGALEDAGKALVMIGVLLAGAQILVAMVNLTGLGVALSSVIIGITQNSIFAIAVVTAVVCLVLGMGIPTTAAYVLVAAVLAPALTKAGVPPLVAHMFVFYYATISTITPPVCIAVFVAAGIAQTGWVAVAREACKLGAVTYVIPFMFIAYPGMLAEGGAIGFLEACVSGTVFTLAFANLFAGVRYFHSRLLTGAVLLAIALLAALPTWYGLVVSTAGLIALYTLRRHRIGAALTETLVTSEARA